MWEINEGYAFLPMQYASAVASQSLKGGEDLGRACDHSS
jgi:hypothetical protein